MPRHDEFTRLFRELTEPLNKAEVARRIGVTPSYVSQLRQGAYGPSRDLLERLMEEYGLDRETWLRAGGYLKRDMAAEADERTTIARLAAEEAIRRLLEAGEGRLRMSEAERGMRFLTEGFQRLRDEYGAEVVDLMRISVPKPDMGEGAAKELLRQIETDIRAELRLPAGAGIFL